ncbi:hypothetical protein L7F22_058472 [Adiantum nelumboides]|nr:hypothetical protein [Adiantum nelumboides]
MPLQRIVALPTNTESAFFKGFADSDERSFFLSKTTSHKILAASAHQGLNKAVKKVASTQRELFFKKDKAVVRSQVDEVPAVHVASESVNHREYNCTPAFQPKLLRVAVDVDEVLGSFLSSLNRFIAEKHFLNYDVSEYHVYDFMKIWGCSQAEDCPSVCGWNEDEEILVPEQILAHKDTKTKGKVRRRFLVKFKNYPALDAKWMEEEDLADTPQIVKLYLEAFGLA